MNVLGILGDPKDAQQFSCDLEGQWDNGWYHDSAAAIVCDGEVLAAVEEERISRQKHTGKFPVRAINACLKLARLDKSDIDLFAFGERGGIGKHRDARISSKKIASLLSDLVPGGTIPSTRIRLVDHHLSHAASAFYPSGFEKALIYTADGFGDDLGGTIGIGNKKQIEIIQAFSFEQSLGRYYSAVLPYLGYRDGDEYRMMGLAPYGDPSKYRKIFENLFELLPEGNYALKDHDSRYVTAILSRLGPPRTPGGPFLQIHKDIAASVQESLEKITLHTIRFFKQKTGLNSLCLAGGVAQNCVLNGVILREKLFNSIFVQPASTDAGIPLGAALYVSNNEGKSSTKPAVVQNVYWGSRLPHKEEIIAELSSWNKMISVYENSNIFEVAAELLASGEVIGWVNGRSEFGPRALGNRSLLADPRSAIVRDKVNSLIKERESFRPFAPVIKEEFLCQFFDVPKGVNKLPFMTFAIPVSSKYRDSIPAVTHHDGSARVQTVSEEQNSKLYSLISAFEKLTSLPLLLNTSFNQDGEPIIDSVNDAVVCLLNSDLKYLFIDDILIVKQTTRLDIKELKFGGLRDDCALVGRPTISEGHIRWTYGLTRRKGQTIQLAKESYLTLMNASVDKSLADTLRSQIDQPTTEALDTVTNDIKLLWRQRAIILRPWSDFGIDLRLAHPNKT